MAKKQKRRIKPKGQVSNRGSVGGEKGKVVKKKSSKKSSKATPTSTILDKINNWQALGILLFLISLIGCFVFWDFFTLEKLLYYKGIASDSLTAYYTSLAHKNIFKEAYEAGKMTEPVFSFFLGMGEPFGINDSWSLEQIIWVPLELLKNGLYAILNIGFPYEKSYEQFFILLKCGILFFIYLRVIGIKNYVALVGGLLFAFLGYLIIGTSGWYGHTYIILRFLYLLVAFELFFSKKIWYFLPIPIVLIGISPYLYFYAQFMIVYYLFRYCEVNGWNFKKMPLQVLQMAGTLGLGLLFIFPNILPSIEHYLSSPRGSGSVVADSIQRSNQIMAENGGFADTLHYVTAILRTFSNDIFGAGSAYKGWYNYLEAPIFYCGLISLLLVPQAFTTTVDKRKKIIYGVFLSVWVLIVVFPYLRHAFYRFSGDYYKGAISLFVPLTLIYLGIRGLNQIIKTAKVHIPVLIGTLVFLLILLFYPYESAKDAIDGGIQFQIALFLILFAGLIAALKFPKYKLFAQIGILVLAIIELSAFSSNTINDRIKQLGSDESAIVTTQEQEARVSYNDYTMDALAYLDSVDKSFYRINKEYGSGTAIHGSSNDAQVQGFFGTKRYRSFQEKNFVDFMLGMDIIPPNVETYTRWAPGLSGHPLLHGFGAVKYHLSKKEDSQFLRFGYQKMARFNDVWLFKNQYYLPMGFCYDKYILEEDFAKISSTQKQLTALKACVIDSSENDAYKYLQRFNLSDTTQGFNGNEYAALIQELRKDTLQMTEHYHNLFKGKITLDKQQFLFFPILNFPNWQAKVDNQIAKPQTSFFGLTGFMVPAGTHDIELEYVPTYQGTFGLNNILSWVHKLFLLFAFGMVGFGFWKKYQKKKYQKKNDESELKEA